MYTPAKSVRHATTRRLPSAINHSPFSPPHPITQQSCWLYNELARAALVEIGPRALGAIFARMPLIAYFHVGALWLGVHGQIGDSKAAWRLRVYDAKVNCTRECPVDYDGSSADRIDDLMRISVLIVEFKQAFVVFFLLSSNFVIYGFLRNMVIYNILL